MSNDILRVVLSDMHSGSNYALFLNREWEGKQTSRIIAKSIQLRIRWQFETFAEQIRQAREGKTIELVHNGDAIDGDHHHSGDVCTINTQEQADIHIELMTEFQKRINWQAGDKLYYTKGTRIHTSENEDYIGTQLNAVSCGQFGSWEFLELDTHGVLSCFVHHGPMRGGGANEGNQVRNWLKEICFDAMKDGRRVPDIIYTGHVHDPTYSSFVYREQMVFKTMHGIICPSWQAKTAYAHMRSPLKKNKIGGIYHTIRTDGTITTPIFSVMVTE